MKVSIIIPFWNLSDYVDRCMESVTTQTHTDIEILVVDNGSVDDTLSKLNQWRAKDNRIKILPSPENRGLSWARNHRLDVATGDYICFVDGDDCVAPHYVSSMLEWATENDCKVAVCAYKTNDEKTMPCDIPTTLEMNYPEKVAAKDYYYRIYTDKEIMYVAMWNKIFRRDIFDSLRFVEMVNEDEEIFHRIISQTDSVAVCYDALYYYTIRQGSIMKSAFNANKMDVFNAYEDRMAFFAENGWYDLVFLTMKAYMLKCLELYKRIPSDFENGKEYRFMLMTKFRDMLKKAKSNPVNSKRFLLEMTKRSLFPTFSPEDRQKYLFIST